MKRVPVAIRRAWVPPGFAALVRKAPTIIVGRDVMLTQRLLAHELAHAQQGPLARSPYLGRTRRESSSGSQGLRTLTTVGRFAG